MSPGQVDGERHAVADQVPHAGPRLPGRQSGEQQRQRHGHFLRQHRREVEECGGSCERLRRTPHRRDEEHRGESTAEDGDEVVDRRELRDDGAVRHARRKHRGGGERRERSEELPHGRVDNPRRQHAEGELQRVPARRLEAEPRDLSAERRHQQRREELLRPDVGVAEGVEQPVVEQRAERVRIVVGPEQPYDLAVEDEMQQRDRDDRGAIMEEGSPPCAGRRIRNG